MPGYTKPVDVTAPVYQGVGQELACAWNRATLVTSELALNSVHPLVRLPRGAVVHDITLKATDMDTGGTPTLAFSVGVAGDTERYIRRSTIGTTAGTVRAGNDATATATCIAAAPLAAETTIDLLVQAAAQTAAAGTVEIAVFYTCE